MEVTSKVLDINGRELKVVGTAVGKHIWVKIAGRTHVIDREEPRQRGGKGAREGSDRIVKAPMPGKIIKVLRANGEAVSAGDAVVVLEAMKMEYVLKSQMSGELSGLSVSVGDQVQIGQILFEVKS